MSSGTWKATRRMRGSVDHRIHGRSRGGRHRQIVAMAPSDWDRERACGGDDILTANPNLGSGANDDVAMGALQAVSRRQAGQHYACRAQRYVRRWPAFSPAISTSR